MPCGWRCWTLLPETPLDCLVEPGFAEKSIHGEVVLEALLSDITTGELPRWLSGKRFCLPMQTTQEMRV